MTAISEGTMDTGAERRSDQRRRVFRGARLTFNGGYGSFECVIRNESERGARLSLGDALAVPARFELVRNDESAGRMAIMRWRRLTEIGVEFEARAATAA